MDREHPDMKDRYYLFPMLDAWTNVFQDPGKRTTGTKPQKYAITGPGWTGTLPAGVTEYKSPTGMVWVLGRIYCTGTPEQCKVVHALQDQVSAVPLSAYGKPYTPAPGTVDPAIDMKPPCEQVNAMDGATYFKLFAELLKTNPPRLLVDRVYDKDYFFVPNPINRYTVSSRSKFKVNADGSVDIFIQHESPGKDKEDNWLPAPAEEFVLMMRLYWPKDTPSILDGSWKPPRVQKAS